MPLILGTNSIKDTGYDVANSLRFNSGSSDYLNNTNSTPTNNDICTFSFWIKFCTDDVSEAIFSAHTDGSNRFQLFRLSSGKMQFFQQVSGSTNINLTTNRLFRDVSAWYNFVYEVDTSQSTDSNRIKMYVNGVQETSFSTETYPSQNTDIRFNTNSLTQEIGRANASDHGSYYLTEFVFVDGTALDQTSFGEFDEDSPTIWKPKDVSGLTFGNNGFYLDFENSSGLGNDAAGTNHFSVNNLTAIDQSTDTCTNNFATFNSLDNTNSQFTFSEGNLTGSYSGSNGSGTGSTATFGLSQGKWYWELKYDSSNDTPLRVGITDRVAVATSTTNRVGFGDNDFAYDQFDGKIYTDNDTGSSYGATYAVGDIIGVALDLDNNKIYFSKNGTFQNSGNPAGNSNGFSITSSSSIANGFYFPVVGLVSGSGVAQVSYNFGSAPYSISSGNADGEGFGNFEYAPPSGFFAICTKNLAEYG